MLLTWVMTYADILRDLETMVKDIGMRIQFNASVSHLQQVNSNTATLLYDIKGGREDHDFFLTQIYSHSSKLNVPDELRPQIALGNSFYPLDKLQGYIESSDHTSLQVTCAKDLAVVATMFILEDGDFNPELHLLTRVGEIRDIAREGGYQAVFSYLLDFMQE